MKADSGETNEKFEARKCLICLDMIEIEHALYFLPCWHFFHEHCICTWLSRNVYCPLCRIPIFIETAEQMKSYEEYAASQIEDEKNRLNNVDNDVNSISYRFMVANGIRSLFGYDDASRRASFYYDLVDAADANTTASNSETEREEDSENESGSENSQEI